MPSFTCLCGCSGVRRVLSKLLNQVRPRCSGPEVMKLQYSLKLKIKRMVGYLRTRVRKQQIIALYFEFKNELKFINLRTRPLVDSWFPISFDKFRGKKTCAFYTDGL